jgi:hypothetical protein
MNQKGQVLVIAIVVMSIVLSASVVISSRFFKSLHVFTKSDNSSKALYVAESLTERLLAKPDQELMDFVSNNNCLQNCYVSFEDGAEAYATLSILGNSSDTYKFKNAKDNVIEVNLAGYPSGSYLDICWNEQASLTAMYIYENGGNYTVDNYAYNSVTSSYPSNFEVAAPNYTYANCFRVSTTNTPEILRIKALYEDAYISIIPNPSSILPTQGVVIASNGRFLDAYKRILVTKRSSIVPQDFDFVLYQRSDDTSLSK